MSNNFKQTKSTLFDINSANRNINPKYRYQTGNILPHDPLTFIQDSNLITVKYPNHGFLSGDQLIVQNVISLSKTLTETFYLLNKFPYLIIIFKNNEININYSKYIKSLYVNIELYGQQTIDNIIDNIPINNFLGIKQIFTYNDLPSLLITTDFTLLMTTIFGENVTTTILNKNTFYIPLLFPYSNINSSYVNLNQFFKITYLNIAGIPLSYINANFPINNDNNQSYQQVYNVIDNNNFQIQLKIKANTSLISGGNTIQMMKIIDTISGYPNSNTYSIFPKKSFNNVTRIELISTEFPYTDLTIRKNVNDKLYWQHINDGSYIYSIQINEGNYTTDELVAQLNTNLNSTPRIISTSSHTVYNYFNVTFSGYTNTITFENYIQSNLPNSMSASLQNINNENYIILTIIDPNNIVAVSDFIIISNVSSVTYTVVQNSITTIYSVPSQYINGIKQVNSINDNNKSYNIILGPISSISVNIVGIINKGGTDIIIQSKTLVSLLFNKHDTIGGVIGFFKPGDTYSITPFLSTITNQTPYINSFNNDTVGNPIIYSSNFINLSGKYDYFLMYLNNIEYIYSNNDLPSAFAKILLSGNPGDILFNTFVTFPNDLYSKDFPINTLTQFDISFYYPDGTPVHFRNINHSFTLRIVEEYYQNTIKTNLNSNTISYAKEMIEAKPFL